MREMSRAMVTHVEIFPAPRAGGWLALVWVTARAGEPSQIWYVVSGRRRLDVYDAAQRRAERTGNGVHVL